MAESKTTQASPPPHPALRRHCQGAFSGSFADLKVFRGFGPLRASLQKLTHLGGRAMRAITMLTLMLFGCGQMPSNLSQANQSCSASTETPTASDGGKPQSGPETREA